MRFGAGVPKRDRIRQNSSYRGQGGQATLLRGAHGEIRQAGYEPAERLLPASRRDHGLRSFDRADDWQGNGFAGGLRTVAREGQNQNAQRVAALIASDNWRW